jgi:hypothetical protein
MWSRTFWHNRRRYEKAWRELKDLLATRSFIGMNASVNLSRIITNQHIALRQNTRNSTGNPCFPLSRQWPTARGTMSRIGLSLVSTALPNKCCRPRGEITTNGKLSSVELSPRADRGLVPFFLTVQMIPYGFSWIFSGWNDAWRALKGFWLLASL